MTEKPPPYKIFTTREINAMFHEVVKLCDGLDDHKEIIKIIDQTFYNRFMLGIPLDKAYSTLTLYRITRPYDGMNNKDASAFLYPENPSRGRANLAGHPVLYCAMDRSTALNEMKDFLSVGQTLYMCEWEARFTSTTLSHCLFVNSKTVKTKNHINKVVRHQLKITGQRLNKVPKEYKQGMRQLLIRLGDLFSLKESKYYNITSAYAHDVLYNSASKGVDIPILIYPSVATDFFGLNYAIHPRFLKSGMLRMTKVVKMEVTKKDAKDIKASISEKGVVEESGSIQWFKPAIDRQHIDYNNLSVVTSNNYLFSGTKALLMQIADKNLTVSDFLRSAINDDLRKHLTSRPSTIDAFDISSTKDTKYVNFQCVSGYRINTPKGLSDIVNMTVPVTWVDGYVLI